MKPVIVDIPSVKNPIKRSPGFEKKQLATHKLDIMGLCGFGCLYCSSNEGNYLRINREKFAKATREQVGEALLPTTSPELSFRWIDFEEQLQSQLNTKPNTILERRWGYGQTLVFSQLTDAFSPWAVSSGLTGRTLEKVLSKTGFRIRVLTKNAAVGYDNWIQFFKEYPGRFVVGLSIGTLDDEWAKRVEIGTSVPSARVRALHKLQDAGVPTYGMLCPVFPEALSDDGVGDLVRAIRPDRCETVWSEPYNDRGNWRHVAAGYQNPNAARRIEIMFTGPGHAKIWSSYAVALYERVHAALGADKHKHRYLLYQDTLTPAARESMQGAEGVLFQSAEPKKSLQVVQ